MPRHLTRAPAVAAPPGQIDLTCQDRAFDQVHAAVARGAAVVVADFTATTFCDCSSGRDLMRRSEYARLLARLESMPVIEQAKGIIMAQSRCGTTEAFDLLRRASQRSNVPVRDLAAQIVAKTAQASLRSRALG